MWTSSNNYAFMAIVVHYVTKSGQLGGLLNYLTQNSETNGKNNTSEELLINFCELEGKHSRANMAKATWEMLTHFRIEIRYVTICLLLRHAECVSCTDHGIYDRQCIEQ
jgi:hypothetical protein